MRTSLVQRGLGIALALTLVLAAPRTARAEEDLSLVELKQELVSLEYTDYEYTGEEIAGIKIYWNINTTLTAGDYRVELFADNFRIASRTFTLGK